MPSIMIFSLTINKPFLHHHIGCPGTSVLGEMPHWGNVGSWNVTLWVTTPLGKCRWELNCQAECRK